MTSTKTILGAALVAAVLGTAATASAQGFHGHGGGPDGYDLLHGLQLTDAQQTQVHQVIESGMQATRAAHQQMHALHDQIESKLLSSGSVSEADLAPLVQQEEQLRSSVDAAKLGTALQLRAILTPSQLAQAASTHAQLASLHAQAERIMGASAGQDGPPPSE